MRWLKTKMNRLGASLKSLGEFEGYGAGFQDREPQVIANINEGIRGVNVAAALFDTERQMHPYGDTSGIIDEGRSYQKIAHQKADAISARSEHAKTSNDAIRMGVAAGVLDNAADGGGISSRSQVAKLLKEGRAAAKKDAERGA